MKRLALSLFLAGTMMAGSLHTKTQLRGDYIEARTADVYTGACFANSEVDLVGNLAVFGWRVEQGTYEGVKLDGLSVVGVVRANNTLGNIHSDAFPAKSVVIIDERANPEQRLALRSFARRMGGDLLQDIVRVEYQPIELTFQDNNVHSRVAKLAAGSLAQIQTRALNKGDQICHNEETWYGPLTKLDHAMPAYTVAHSYKGAGLNTTWSNPEKRSAFVGSFQLTE